MTNGLDAKPNYLNKAFFDDLYALDNTESEDENDVNLFTIPSLARKPKAAPPQPDSATMKETEPPKTARLALSDAEGKNINAPKTASTMSTDWPTGETRNTISRDIRKDLRFTSSTPTKATNIKVHKTDPMPKVTEKVKPIDHEVGMVKTPGPKFEEVATKPKPPAHLCWNLLEEKLKRTPKSKKKAVVSRGLIERSDLFDGYHFYFIPNSVKNPVRLRAMESFHEHGACILKEWDPNWVTHILVDSSWNLDYAEVLKDLKTSSVPDHIIVVLDIYPSDCIKYRRLVDHKQFMYDVPRTPTAPASPPPLSLPQSTANFIKETPPRSYSDSSKDTGNELQAAILEAKKLPFLDDHYESSSSKELNVDSDSDESRIASPRKKAPRLRKDQTFGFQCMNKNDGTTKNNPNQRTIEILSEMGDYYARVRDEWRSMSYRKAVATLRKQTKKIWFASEARKLPNIGERLADKIEEIVQTDSLRRLEYARDEPGDAALKLFLGVYGAGLKHAQQWVAKGHTTLQDLLDKEKLSASQRIGVERHADFAQRIPREEVRHHGELVIKAALEIDGELKLEIMGSYRRGAKDCGDIDVMITKEDAGNREMRGVLDTLTTKLTAMGFLKCGLAIPRGHDDGSKWHGASQLSPELPWRRIDFLIVPWAERGAALLYFTGNDIFNRSMRLLASKKGYRLNQRGLYKDVIRGPQRQKITEGTLVEGEDEKRIFKILGVPYRPPSDRNC
ncbi:hypothetical protein FN846DRAFT_945182 [Sphaerosporella brunnea]|uniref:DNA polymerase lambda n=1 Tax=Sphaerosporella brunnea TaxID=1250544 RepID=A0A5J5F0H4_9PEZI|nr:hypothetical protein FN846DRAFT_945182 [Sphaerosporella brunnea]